MPVGDVNPASPVPVTPVLPVPSTLLRHQTLQVLPSPDSCASSHSPNDTGRVHTSKVQTLQSWQLGQEELWGLSTSHEHFDLSLLFLLLFVCCIYIAFPFRGRCRIRLYIACWVEGQSSWINLMLACVYLKSPFFFAQYYRTRYYTIHKNARSHVAKELLASDEKNGSSLNGTKS